MRHLGRAHHWIWLGIGLAATLLSARAVHDQMLAASRSDLASYCDSLDEVLVYRVEEPIHELIDVIEHLAEHSSDGPALLRNSGDHHGMHTAWLLEDGAEPRSLWPSTSETECPMPPLDRVKAVVLAARSVRTGAHRVTPVESSDCGECVWLVADAGPGQPMVLAEAGLEGLFLSVSERLASRAAGEVYLRVGQTVTPLLGLSQTRAIDPKLTESREIEAYGGLVTIGYQIRSYADTWTVLRPIVSISVLVLGATASVLLFVVLRILSASALRESRLRDLSQDLRARDRDIQRRRAEAEAASASKSNLLRQTSHNIRSPLTSILGTTESLLAQHPSCDARHQLNAVHSSATHLLALANDLLDAARVESGLVSIAVRDVEPAALLHEVIEGFRSRARHKGLALEVVWESDVPTSVRLDPTRLREILINLIENAVRHTVRGGVTLFARIDEETENLHLDVVDTGEGIDRRILAELLDTSDPDPRFSPSRGTCGLGLVITRHLVTAMDGTISAESDEGSGTVFTLVLPVGPICWREQCASSSPIVDAASVLVVDDAPEVQQFMHLALGRMGLAVHGVGSGSEARAAASNRREGAYRLVFLDQHLVDTTGIELCKALREELPTAIFIALTGDTDPDAERRYTDAGLDAYLPKPFKQDQLAALLERFANDRQDRAA
jgi:signal transduction histidine kinase/ActR/RegA family two-component response regulator